MAVRRCKQTRIEPENWAESRSHWFVWQCVCGIHLLVSSQLKEGGTQRRASLHPFKDNVKEGAQVPTYTLNCILKHTYTIVWCRPCAYLSVDGMWKFPLGFFLCLPYLIIGYDAAAARTQFIFSSINSRAPSFTYHSSIHILYATRCIYLYVFFLKQG